MSFLDRIAAAVAPTADAEERAEARRKAQMLAGRHGWLEQILVHHRQIEDAFGEAMNSDGSESRRAAAKKLGALLTGHSMAEEAVIYPAVSQHDGKAHATMAYEEQAMTKVQFALLEQLDPMSQEWREKLEHIQAAVQQHVYQEESSWFPEVAETIDADMSAFLTQRYQEETGKYFGAGEKVRQAASAVL